MTDRIPRLILAPALWLLSHAISSHVNAQSGQENGQNRRSWEPPNIVYILADDLGYGDIGAYGQRRARTPSLDDLAAQGMVYSQHYSGSTVCAPSRSVLLTGQHTGNVRIRGNMEFGGFLDEEERGQMPLEEEITTLAEVLKNAGYATAAIGKWGLGGPGTTGVPRKHGFDYFFGYLDQKQAHNYFPTHLWENETSVPLNNAFFIPHAEMAGTSSRAEDYRDYMGNEYAPDVITAAALDWIRENSGDRFFLYFALSSPHAALQVPDEEVAAYEGAWEEIPLNDGEYTPHPKPRAARAGMVSRMDRDIGRLLETLAELQIDNETLVIFASDNGPGSEGGADLDFFASTAGLRGEKRDLYEGGIRVPMIVRWPGVISPGQTTDHVSAFWDILPTFAELSGQPIPDHADGLSMVPLFLGQPQPVHNYLYWEFHAGSESAMGETMSSQAVRLGRWKAVRTFGNRQGGSETELFDLVADPGETANVASLYPDTLEDVFEIFESRTESPFAEWNFPLQYLPW